MFKIPSTNTAPVIIAVLLILTAMSSDTQVVASPVLQQPARFLSPPFYGITAVTSVFDHDLPLISTQNDPDPDGNPWTMHYDGTRDGPGARSSYDQHRGIDYALRYKLVRAAAPGTVAQAGWASTDHRASYGLHVRIDHADGFRTIYGHMSVLRVQTGDLIPSAADEFQHIIGHSGNTGWCQGVEGTGPNGRCTDNDPPTCGAHLHFQLEHNGRVVNPYGWIGATADPWSQRADGATSVDRWLRYPSITNGDVFTSGAPLIAPPIAENEPGAFTVDDGDADFQATPNCWQANQAAPGWGGDYLTRTIPGGACTATWNFAQTRVAGRYNVFVHIPNDNVAPGDRRATVDAARYAITHTVSSSQPWSKQTQIVVVDQWAYPNDAHTSRWVYLGAYYFDTNQYGTDYVRLESQPLNPITTTLMAADAVRFAPVRYRVYLPLVMKRWPPIPDTPVLNPIDNPNGSSGYTVSWQAAYLASTYTLQEATNANFTGAVTRYTGTATSWTASGKAPGTYYYRVEATNSWGDSGWSNVQQTTVLLPAGWQTIASQNFEGTFPGAWVVWDNNGPDYGEYYWGKRTCRPYAGSYSGWGVGGGAQGAALSCGSYYPHNANGWTVYGPFDLQDVMAAELKFKLWLYTELQNDTVFYGASVNGTNFYGYAVSGNTQGWVDKSLNLASVPTLGSLLGRSQVWVTLVFASNGSTAYAEGGYMDDVVLRQCYRECPSGSSASASGNGQTQEVAVMMTRNRGGTLGAPSIEPQPFVSPLSTPEPFRSPLPVPAP